MNYQELQEAKNTFRLKTLEKEFQKLYKERELFVKRFNDSKIASMTINDYVIGRQNKNSFCYIIERILSNLGSIKGQPSNKFGVWYSPSEGIYKFEIRFGDDYSSAFNNVKKAILDLLDKGAEENYEGIIHNPLNSLFKGKILSVYFPDKYLNIFSVRHLDYYIKFYNLDTKELMKADPLFKRKALIDFKNSDKDMRKWSVNMFACFLWSHYPKSPIEDNEVAVNSKETELEFPTIDNISFVNLELDSSHNPEKKNLSSFISPDYEKEAKKYKKLGDRGEYIVFQAEIKRLQKELNISEGKAKKLIKWVSCESDAFGFDIESINKDGTKRYIEVKATQNKVGNMDFYYTENERETAEKYGKSYFIYIVYDILSTTPCIWIIKNPISNGNLELAPIKYKVKVRVK